MSTLFCKWPATSAGLTAAEAYKAECDARFAELTEEEGGVWALIRPDVAGRHTVPLFGPPWSYDGVNPIEEPASCADLRTGAEVVSDPAWPPPEE